MVRVLIASPVQQHPKVLSEFLESLKRLKSDDTLIDYCFIDDNTDEESSKVLKEFRDLLGDNVTLINSEYNSKYFVDDYTHRWSQHLIDKITKFKNIIIDIALEKEYDYLFFIDSDIVLHPKTLDRLVSLNKEIISNIFWTKWGPDSIELPQVWLKDAYTMYDFMTNESLTQLETQQKTMEFLKLLRRPGTYKVGGLGACTLIARSALLKGVNFDPVYNISFWGEDRHFCIRAAALGIQLWVDTYYPAYHIYRLENLNGIEDYKNSNEVRDLEILGHKLVDKAISAIEGANTYSFNEEINKSFLMDCENSEGELLLSQYENQKEYIADNKLINRLKIVDARVDIQNPDEVVIINVTYVQFGYKNGLSFNGTYTGQCIMLKYDSQWKVAKWIPLKEESTLTPHIVRKIKYSDNKLTLSMVIKDTSVSYLRKTLESAKEYIDNAVIYDISHADEVEELIKSILSNIPYKLIKSDLEFMGNENIIRKQQWEATIEEKPDWIIFLDGDECFEDKFKNEVKGMISNLDCDGYIFSTYDFWDEENFRDDPWWNNHNAYKLYLIRYQENYRYILDNKPINCERIPINSLQIINFERTLYRVKKFEMSNRYERLMINQRLLKLDPNGYYGQVERYNSIIDEKPNLVRWHEDV